MKIGLGIGLSDAAVRRKGLAPAGPGPELWPQPTMADSAGLTFINSSFNGAGAVVGDTSGSAARVYGAVAPIAPGTYSYALTVDQNPSSMSLSLGIGDQTVSIGPLLGDFTGTLVVTSVDIRNYISLINALNDDIIIVTALSVHKTG